MTVHQIECFLEAARTLNFTETVSLLMLPAYYSLINGGGKKRVMIAD